MSTSYVRPRAKLARLGSPGPLLWIVAYVNAGLRECFTDLENAFDNGADAVVFETRDAAMMDEFLVEIRARYPARILGVDVLGSASNRYNHRETFALARKHRLQIAWTPFSGVDLIEEAEAVNLHDIERETTPDIFYISGIHMKYSTLLDVHKAIEKSALQALGWVDGLIVTGARTGAPADVEKVKRVRTVVHDYPLGLASGVSANNIRTFLPYIDYVLVHTSIADANHRILPEQVRALRRAMAADE
jgi:hypothetical protein